MTTVLLVEDFADNREYFATVLRRHGYDVIEAVDGQEALRLARRRRPDLILMDLSLPNLDGWAATEELKSDPTLCDIPVVALTAHTIAGDDQRAREAGCDDYLAKPVLPKELLANVQRHVGLHAA